MFVINILLFFFIVLFPLYSLATQSISSCSGVSSIVQNRYFVSINGNNYDGDGSRNKPWKNISTAINKVPDGSTIIVTPGVYHSSINITKEFKQGVIIKSEIAYMAKLTNSKRVVAFTGNASNITLEGFEITHSSSDSSPLVVHIDGGGNNSVHHITIKNNIIHDSFNNDLLKINNGAEHITVECNMFYNQGDFDEHIDINSVKNIKVTANLFFNSFEMSERKNTGKSSSFIVIKDSNGRRDNILGAEHIEIDSNIFFNWQGSPGHGFILIGEDGKKYYEAKDILIFNNLLLGNSKVSMRSPMGVKGAKNVSFFNNTVSGDLPSNAYAIRINREGNNLINNNIALFNNIWSDVNGTMGQGDYESNLDFSDIIINQLSSYYFNNNLVFNGGNKIPYSFFDKINPSDDKYLSVQNPYLPEPKNIQLPIWNKSTKKFSDGSNTIRMVFMNLLYLYGIPNTDKVFYNSKQEPKIPKNDIRGEIRTPPYSLGALQLPFKHTKADFSYE